MARLPEYAVLDLKLERLPSEALLNLQAERLRAMVRYVYDATPFWRQKFEAINLVPDDIEGLADLSRIPFVTKQELQDDQAANPPFGSYSASPPSTWTRFMATSGTTGRPLRRVFSARDWQTVLDRFQRNPVLGPGDTAVILGPIDGLMGPMAGAEGLARSGALVVLAGLYPSRTKGELIRELRPTALSGSASYLLHLANVATEMGVDLAALGIKGVLSVGEPGAAVPATRQRLAERYGAFVNDGYGLTELFPLGGGCLHSTALHVASDLVITEIIDPESGQPLPPGEPGEIVYTNLIGDTQPLLRYRTRDIGRLETDAACACGFTGARLALAIEGRVDDMIWFRGANLFPSAIEAVVRGFAELGDEYRIVVAGDEKLPTLTVEVEAADDGEDLAGRLTQALQAAVGVGASVEILPPSTLPQAEANQKARRVVDRRKSPPPHPSPIKGEGE